MKRIVLVATFGWLGGAFGQPLPSPQFSSPATADSSSRAATTAWVRSQNLLSATGDLSSATIKPAGATVARTAAARAADTFNVLDYGAVADGATDIGPALNAISAKLSISAPSNVIYFPAGSYRLATPVTFSGVAPILVGQGFTQGPALGGTGTWIKIDAGGVTPITFSGVNSRGAQVRDIAFYEVHPAPAAGWAPNPNDYVFRVLNALGEVKFDNVLFAGVNRGIYADNSGRLNIKDVQGQFYTAGVEIDDCYDIPRIERLHSWPFYTGNTNVMAYQTANENTVILHRVDGIFIGDLFSIAAHSVLHLTSGVNGVTTKAYVSNLYADLSDNGVLIDGPGSTIQIANMTSQGNDPTNGANFLPNSHAVWINTNGVVAQVSNLASSLTAGPAVEVDSYGNNLSIGNLNSHNWGTAGANTPAIFVTDSGSNSPNNVYVGNKELLQGSPGQPLYNPTSNGGRERFVMMNDSGGPNVNEMRAYSAAPGGAPEFAPVGADANIDMYLTGKGTSGVRLQSAGQTVLRVDNLNASTDDFLLRGGAATLNWIAEGGDANIDVDLNGKGTSGVRLQSSGQPVLRVDNLNASADDLLVRGGSDLMDWIAEGGDANIDLYLSPKGASGGVRLQGNGDTVLRVDNINTVADDLLVRAAGGQLNFVAEGADANIDFYLTPKGPTGGVRLQGNGQTVLRIDDANSSRDDVLVRGASDAMNFTAEGADSNIDLVMSPQGATGGVRLQANSATILRVDNPNAGTSDLLARSGAATMSLTVEDPSANASLVLNPKGAGLVSASNCPGAADSSNDLACTSWVKGLGYVTSTNLSPLATQPALASQPVVGTNSAGQLVAAAVQGTGPKVQLANGAAVAGDCVKFDANGDTIDAGAACGVGSGVGGITALTGDVSASGSGSVTATLAAVGAPGAYTKVTTDSKGRVTAGGALSASDVSGALGFSPLPTASPSPTGTTTIKGFNSIALTGAATGAAPSIAAAGGDASVDLSLSAAGSTGSARLLANGATVFRADNPGGGNSDLLVRAGTGVASLTVESASASGNLALNPKGSGTVSAPTPAATDNSTTVATTAYVQSQNYISSAGAPVQSVAGRTGAIALAVADVSGAAPLASPSLTGTTSVVGSANSLTLAGAATTAAPTLAAIGTDAGVDLYLASKGSTGSVRLRANGSTVLRTDSPTPGTSDVLVRSGAGAVSFTGEDPGSTVSFSFNPKGAGAFAINGAANNVVITPAATTVAPTVAATGTDANVSLEFKSQGTGSFVFAPGSGGAVLTPASGSLQVAGTGTNATNLGSNGGGGSVVAVRGALAQQGYQYVNAGAAYSVPGNTDRVILGAAATSPFTLTLNAAPNDGQLFTLECDAGLAVAIAPGTGTTMGGTTTSCSATQGHQWHYRQADAMWRMDY